MIDIAVDIVVSQEAEVESESVVDLEVDVEITLSVVSCFFLLLLPSQLQKPPACTKARICLSILQKWFRLR